MLERREVTGVTIDGPASRDLDDGIWVEPRGDGYLVRVSIADVAAEVPAGSPEDVTARQRAETRYGATYVRHMLPEGLAADVCSLLPGQTRQTLTVDVALAAGLAVESVEVYRSKFRSQRRLDYALVDSCLVGGKVTLPRDVRQLLTTSWELAQQLLAARRAAGALAVYDLVRGWVTDETGTLVQRDVSSLHRAQMVVQEFMILANRAVAGWMAERGVTGLYRVHAGPAGTDRDEFLADLGAVLGEGLPLEGVRAFNLRIPAARYSHLPALHWGLCLPAYTHFTSPIRRYADLHTHREVGRWLDSETAGDVEVAANLGEELTAHRLEVARRTSEGFKRANRQGSAGTVQSWPEDVPSAGHETAGEYLTRRETELHKLASEVYAERLAFGVAREQARKDLPLSTYTESFWKIDLHNLLHFLALRLDPHAQAEIRTYAEVLGGVVAQWCPLTWEAFQDFRTGATYLSRTEAEIVSAMAQGSDGDAVKAADAAGWLEKDASTGQLTRNREREEAEAKLRSLGLVLPW